MPKMKTKSAAKKRFKVTATGKVLFRRAGLRHILTKKSKKRKRAKGNTAAMFEGDARRFRIMLGEA